MDIFLVILGIILFYTYLFYFILLLGLYPIKSNKSVGKFPFVSVIIPTKDDESVIEATLKKIKKLNYPKNRIEIIVVDGSKTDKTIRIARKYASKIVIDNYRKGKGHALNLGIKKSKGEVLYFMDSDTHPERNTIKNLVSNLSEQYVACTGPISVRDVGLISEIDRIQSIGTISIQRGLSRVFKTPFILGRNFIILKSKLIKIKGFKNKLSEDINLSFRLYQKNAKVKFVPNAICYEESPKKFSYFWKREDRWGVGSIKELLGLYKTKNLKSIFLLMPTLVTAALIPVILSAFLLSYLIYNDYFMLFNFIVGTVFAIAAIIKNMSKKDVLYLPISATLLTILLFLAFIISLIKVILNIKEGWYKTPK